MLFRSLESRIEAESRKRENQRTILPFSSQEKGLGDEVRPFSQKLFMPGTTYQQKFSCASDFSREESKILLVGALPEHHNGKSLCEDFYIEEQRLVLNVVEVEHHHFAKPQIASPGNLPQSGHPRLCF